MNGDPSPLLTQQLVSVTSSGEMVTVTVGNAPLHMDYERALDLSRWMREEAAEVKSRAGFGRTVRSLGTLEDLNAKKKPLPVPGGVAIHVKPASVSWSRRDVWSEGSLICVRVGRHAFKLPCEASLQLSQWLRVQAKACQRRAGDARHWSEIGDDNE